MALEWHWNCTGASTDVLDGETFQWNCFKFEMNPKLLWNGTGMALELHWNCSATAL